MRQRFPEALTVVGLAVLLGSCASHEGRLRATPPTQVSVFLRQGPVPGGCAAVTHPQVVHVFKSDALHWNVVNVSCPPATTVELEFERPIIDFEPVGANDCPTPRQNDKGSKPVFCFQARGKVVAAKGRHKYKVKLSTGFVEDPEVEIYPPPG